ncbi:DUF4919 domain-containing protein [Aquirhabdus sp.]|uniref:DUF4919 domain-containing protein n=1 Tax=Aquirhabdus sp. TaxID=2824160 RepID=UPI00396C4B7B
MMMKVRQLCQKAILLMLLTSAHPLTYADDATQVVLNMPSSATDVDYAKLRNDYGQRDDFEKICIDKPHTQEMVIAMNTQQFDQLITLTNDWVNQCPVDIQGHLFRGTAFLRTGQKDKAIEQYKWVGGLMKSILASGDGKTSDTAFVTISVPEEYQVLSMMRLRLVKQELIMKPLRDKLDTLDQSGVEHIIYFNPAAHFDRLAKQLNVKKPE